MKTEEIEEIVAELATCTDPDTLDDLVECLVIEYYNVELLARAFVLACPTPEQRVEALEKAMNMVT